MTPPYYVARFHVERVAADGKTEEVGKWVEKDPRLVDALARLVELLQSVQIVFQADEGQND